jgi:hypothetical protein
MGSMSNPLGLEERPRAQQHPGCLAFDFHRFAILGRSPPEGVLYVAAFQHEELPLKCQYR